MTFLFFSFPPHGQNHDRGRQHLSLLIVTVAGAILLAAQQLAAADRASSGEAANPKANSAGPAAELDAVRRLGGGAPLEGTGWATVLRVHF